MVYSVEDEVIEILNKLGTLRLTYFKVDNKQLNSIYPEESHITLYLTRLVASTDPVPYTTVEIHLSGFNIVMEASKVVKQTTQE